VLWPRRRAVELIAEDDNCAIADLKERARIRAQESGNDRCGEIAQRCTHGIGLNCQLVNCGVKPRIDNGWAQVMDARAPIKEGSCLFDDRVTHQSGPNMRVTSAPSTVGHYSYEDSVASARLDERAILARNRTIDVRRTG